MADELTTTIQYTLTRTNITQARVTQSNSVDCSADLMVENVQAIGTSAENLAVGDVATPGYGYYKNLDATNYVEIGKDSGGFVAFVKLKPGEDCWFPIAASITIQAKADTASCNLYYKIFSR